MEEKSKEKRHTNIKGTGGGGKSVFRCSGQKKNAGQQTDGQEQPVDAARSGASMSSTGHHRLSFKR